MGKSMRQYRREAAPVPLTDEAFNAQVKDALAQLDGTSETAAQFIADNGVLTDDVLTAWTPVEDGDED